MNKTKYSYISGEKNKEIYFQSPNNINDKNIYKGTIVEGRINLFNPILSKYYIQRYIPLLKEGTKIKYSNKEESEEIIKPTLTNLEIEISMKNIVNNFNEEDINSSEINMYEFYNSYEELNLMKDSSNSINKILALLNKNYNTLTLLDNLSLFSLEKIIEGHSIEIKDSIKKPEEFIYAIFQNRIQVCQIKDIYLYLSSIENIDRRISSFPEAIYNEDNLVYGLKSEDNIYFETKVVFKRKKDLLNYITKIKTI